MNKYNSAFDIYVEKLTKKMYVKQDVVEPSNVQKLARRYWKSLDPEDKDPYEKLFQEYKSSNTKSDIVDNQERKPEGNLKKMFSSLSLNNQRGNFSDVSSCDSSDSDQNRRRSPLRNPGSAFFKRVRNLRAKEELIKYYEQKKQFKKTTMVTTCGKPAVPVCAQSTTTNADISFIVLKTNLHLRQEENNNNVAIQSRNYQHIPELKENEPSDQARINNISHQTKIRSKQQERLFRIRQKI